MFAIVLAGLAFPASAQADACTTPPAATNPSVAQRSCLLEAAQQAYAGKRLDEAHSLLDRLDRLGASSVDDLALASGSLRARVLFQQGRYLDMERVARETFDRARAAGGPDGSRSLEAQGLLAIALRNRERTDEAIATYFDLLERRKRVNGPVAPETLTVTNNLANALRSKGDLPEAEQLFRSVHEARLRTAGPFGDSTLLAWHNLQSVAWERTGSEAVLREVEARLPAQQQALGRDHAEIVRLKTLLATMLWSQGRLEETHALFSEILRQRRQTLPSAHRLTQEAARNLAFVTLQMGDPDGSQSILDSMPAAEGESGDVHSQDRKFLEALVHLQRGDGTKALQALPSSRNLAGPKASGSDLVEATLRARAQSLIGERELADSLQRPVLEEQERRLGPYHPITLQSMRILAGIRIESGDVSGARALLENFVERSEMRDGMAAQSAFVNRLQLSQSIESLLDSPGYKTYIRLLAATDPTRALEVAELAKGRSLAEPSAVSGRGQVARAEAREAAWRLAKAEEALAANEPGSTAYLQAANQRAEAEAKLRALRPAAGTTKRYGLADRLATLPRNAAFVDYVVDGDRVVALLAGKDLPVTGIDLGRVPGLADCVEALRRLTASQDPSSERVWRTADSYRWALSRPANATARAKDATEIAGFLSTRLLDPLAPHLRKYPRWIVSPDGPLAFLPFELLEDGGKRVVENHEITIAPSLAVITAGKARAARVLAPGPNREFLGIGLARAGGDWPELPAAEREVTAIASLFPADRRITLTGSQATEAAFAKLDAMGDLERFRYIHIASHAFLSPRGASLSGVVLAKDPADESNDGVVTAAEWPVYRLRSDLVVLSACDTGRGTLLAGEGVMGLPYALLQAGTRDVLLTLWPVSDAAAADFMPRFYGRLRKGAPPARALRETKLELARSRGPHAAPAHWAAFVLHGVP